MKMTNEQYGDYVKKKSPPSPLWKNMLRALLVGGIICCIGQGIGQLCRGFGMDERDSAAAVSILLILLSALLTGLGLYDDIARFAGAGTLVPITGFANSVVSPALEFKTEGIVAGLAAKMFVIAGPVIVFGITASVAYGIILVLLGLA